MTNHQTDQLLTLPDYTRANFKSQCRQSADALFFKLKLFLF